MELICDQLELSTSNHIFTLNYTLHMNALLDFLRQPWPWYVAGPIIATVMFLLLRFGNSFGVSSNLRTICSALGAGKNCSFFDFNWKSQRWNLVFAFGMALGGFLSATFLMSEEAVNLSSATVAELTSYGLVNPRADMVPMEIFNWSSLLTIRGFVMLVVGGFFVGFGTRYAGGCTSGHAISGLSNLQLPSLISVIGFFIGGLSVIYIVLPFLLNL